ncbi:MAG: FCD domain-containing protein [Hydrogenophaga sp.]|jgi:DNA-binding GntR family transcriptional regulator|uniref:FCD domain-containing protein n=1 Tax=Hydrogenophaga sp. TaxID=1904254 RepID=UPI002A3609F6|nr:FCD domain-containing protein [Hydrogenophaga sp.]MDX9968948.1 FCD domain-containing protein [Hydrogenophaga sp.]
MPTATTRPDTPEGSQPATPPNNPPEARSLTESAYLRLRRDIIEGRHAPGSKLRIEHLRELYQVSAGTLREALALLVSDSLVLNQAQRGFRVAPMSLEDLLDITRTRTLLECEALKDSIRLGDDQWEARLVSSYHMLSRAEERLLANNVADAFGEWELRNQEFHEALVSACPSAWILRLRSMLYQQSRRYRWLSAVRTEVSNTVHEEHQAIFEAALRRDAEGAERMLKKHLQLALTGICEKGLLR